MALIGAFAYATYVVIDRGTEEFQKFSTTMVLNSLANEIGHEWEKTGQLPDDAEGKSKLKGVTDGYLQPIVYESDGTSFTLRSRGPDGILMTDDDITAGPFSSSEEATSIPELGSSDFDFDGDFGSEEFEAEIEKQIEKTRRQAEKAQREMESKFNQNN